MIESDWTEALDRYSYTYPFGENLKAVKIDPDDVDDELRDECLEQFIVVEVAKGYYITHEDIEEHVDIINEHGLEVYLEKRLELLAGE